MLTRHLPFIDYRGHLGQKPEGVVSVGIAERERAFEPDRHFGVQTSIAVEGRALEALQQIWRNPNVNGETVLRRHGCDLWLKGLQPEIGAVRAINAPLGAISYPQALNAIITG
ncbi:hypothetical protein FJV76_14395 [Mesorhizobium sp. WSM4303]|uniref:hypothetical protein n=1 Tax=Mesorhizobium sp. WSM4303 TaxID=2589887 RepID=UPI00115D9CA7|nr:hypothetical protein [Mesorhizobium sp. WSM4303]TRD03821.1 hypothetical protein FJV76_14395 [Mesorhizobium sp. WSM4303]